MLFAAITFYRTSSSKIAPVMQTGTLIDGTEMFDGLALGSRLAYLALPRKYRYIPFLGAFL
jgi:hypothetical protein